MTVSGSRRPLSAAPRRRHWAAYAWAGPNSLIGLSAAALMLLLGARARRVQGVLEVSGGWLGRTLASPVVSCPFCAITLGHVILGTSAAALDAARGHEFVHVRQYEAWGPLFLPAYVASSAWQILLGRRCYRDNWFERQACERAG
jgi:hypothetical protein